jgi:hypothetical protein
MYVCSRIVDVVIGVLFDAYSRLNFLSVNISVAQSGSREWVMRG